MDVLAARFGIDELERPAVSDPDRDLVDRFQAGERAAFDQLVRRHQKGMWHLVRRYVKRGADASDVTQLAFVRAYKGLVSFRGSATVRSWLYRIAINCALSWLRDHRREEPAEIPDDALVEPHAAPARLLGGERTARLRAAIEQLPPKQKLVLELRVFDDLSFKEVAELAECSENTAKVNFHYAVKRLRDILGGGDEA
ncbi:MAG: sigma-70 family RNA polymerase sigma factor [Deltaproteobacteria bacterium]|nr:sigma-70 family RNA polymerase sigma factor [Deltaproteobacteria bacterium]